MSRLHSLTSLSGKIHSFKKLIPFVLVAMIAGSFTWQWKNTFSHMQPGPVKSFEENCARCHGPQGKFYGKGFGRRPYKELRHMVKEMMEGPAFMNPSSREVSAMTAYHHGLSQGDPFICLTQYDSSRNMLHGEVIPGNHLFLKSSPKNLTPVPVTDDGSWNATLPPGARLVVKNDSARIMLNPDKNQWSHQGH